jgi:Virulence factor
MAKLTTIYWRDIPAQVIAKERRQSAKRQLTNRFEAAIDRAAMRAKMSAADDYIGEWRRGAPVDCDDDLERVVTQAAQAIEEKYNDECLKTLIQNKGFEAAVEE